MGRLRKHIDSQALGTAAMSSSYTVPKTGAGNFMRLKEAHFKFSSSSSNIITITRNSADGTTYDTVLDTTTLSSETSYVYKEDNGVALKYGDVIDFAVNKSGSATVYLTAIFEDNQ